MSEKLKNTIIVILIMVSIVSVSYIIYNKAFISKDNEEIKDKEENNNASSNENSGESSNDLEIDFKKLFEDAEKTYALFTPYNLPNVDCENSKLDNYCILKGEYKSLKELEDQVNKLFTKQLSSELLGTRVYNNDELYKEENNVLYRINGYVGQIDYTVRENNLTITKVNDEKVIIHNDIHFDKTEFMDERTIPYDYVVIKENGNWVFNNFELPASFYF